MKCPKCDKENLEGAGFCMRCGATLALVCPQCRAKLPLDPDLQFCTQCGARIEPLARAGVGLLDRPALGTAHGFVERLERLVPKEYAERLLATRGEVHAERRIVTILFSDVKGSTLMAEGLDPEDWMEIMDGALDVLIEPIYRYEGTLARLMGDGFLAFFGAPIAHENDAERACRAAVEIVKGAKRYSVRLGEERGITGFDVRVGIHTGTVVVGEVGSDLRVEYTAMGDAVNLAARMESSAEPGTVLISKATHRLVAPLFETEALGRIEVKGKTELVAVHRVLGLKDVPDKVGGIAGLESPMVGRQSELARLWDAVERLQAGVGGVVTVVGEAGIGKSRLVAELHKQAMVGAGLGAEHAPCLRWVEGRCLSYGASIAYLLWLDVLRELLGVTVDASLLEVRDALRELLERWFAAEGDELLPFLARMMSLPLEPEEEEVLRLLEGEQLKARTFQAVIRLVEAAARERPLVLVLEDLHWADPTSLELLEQSLALTDRGSLLLVCVFRPRRECGCWRIRELAARDYPHRHTDLWLSPLSSAESEMLVGNLLRAEGTPAWFREKILSVTEGNPFFVEEVLRGLINQGVVVRKGRTGRWHVAEDAATVRLPDTLQGALVARIDRLQGDVRRVLQMAAVIGRVFLYRILEAIAAEEEELEKCLLTLQREDMIRERARIPELEYIFKHELTREAAYNGLLKAERRAFHRQVAQALQSLFPDRIEEIVGLLAHHWEWAGDAAQATEWLLRAGDHARLAYAHQEAIEYYQRALALLKEQGELERAARTLMRVGLTYHNAFDHQRSRDAYDEGFALWQQAGQIEPATPMSPAPHSLRVGVAWVDSPNLDPALHWTYLTQHLFSGLAAATPEMEVVPDIARRWEVLAEGRKYVFHLREDVRWSDGIPLTAHDFEYAWKRVLDPASGSPFASLLYDIKGARAYHRGQAGPQAVGVRARDAATLIVELEGPTGYFLHLLTHSVAFPVPRHTLEARGEDWTATDKIVTNGPFRLERWIRGERLVLARSSTYHGCFRGNVEEVELVFLGDLWGTPDWHVRPYALYEAGALDVVVFYSQGADRLFRGKHAGEHVSFPALWVAYVGFDLSQPPFNDLRLRRAFALAIDRERFVQEVWQGLFTPATGGVLPPGMPGHSPGIGVTFDPVLARQLLAEAGFPEGLQFPHVKGVGGHPREVENLQAQWHENLGVEVKWDVLDVATAYETLATDLPPLYWAAWSADYPDPDALLGRGLHQPFHNWHNDGYEALVEEGRRLTDQEQRMALYRRADRILMEEVLIFPVMSLRVHLLVKPWVRTYPMSLTGDVFWKDVVIDTH